MSCIQNHRINWYNVFIHVVLIVVLCLYLSDTQYNTMELEKQLNYHWGYYDGMAKVLDTLRQFDTSSRLVTRNNEIIMSCGNYALKIIRNKHVALIKVIGDTERTIVLQPNNDLYIGDIDNRMRRTNQGKQYMYTDKELYIGSWTRDKRFGNGIHILTNGSYYEGTFVNNVMHGLGTWHYGTHNVTGIWNHGKFSKRV